DWEDGFLVLERFGAREGHVRVPKTHIEEGYPLGQWANEQRTVFRAGRLPDDRTSRLKALPGWCWNLRDAAWEDGFRALQRFAAREGDARVPMTHVEDDYRLGQWVVVQRSFHGSGRLSPDRIARLAAL